MHSTKFLLLALAALLAAAGAGADSVAVGAEITPFSITDQHGRLGAVDDEVRVLLFSRDMTANKLAKEAFMDKPADYLPSAHAMYLIDVSGMPGFVTRHFAIPKMQKYVYPIFLDREGDLTAALPAHEDEVTIMTVDHMTVTSVEYARAADALNRAVEAASE